MQPGKLATRAESRVHLPEFSKLKSLKKSSGRFHWFTSMIPQLDGFNGKSIHISKNHMDDLQGVT
jgi:hypothetical protein